MSEMTSTEKRRERQKRYNMRNNYADQKRYKEKSQHPITFKFHNEADKDILEFFEKQDSKLAVLREAMRLYMKNQ